MNLKQADNLNDIIIKVYNLPHFFKEKYNFTPVVLNHTSLGLRESNLVCVEELLSTR